MAGLELWGGHECTVNRVGDQFFDQTVRRGTRPPQGPRTLRRVGFKALRYPVLWERISPDRP
jgi:dTDP-4-dehydrorhamnose reductase